MLEKHPIAENTGSNFPKKLDEFIKDGLADQNKNRKCEARSKPGKTTEACSKHHGTSTKNMVKSGHAIKCSDSSEFDFHSLTEALDIPSFLWVRQPTMSRATGGTASSELR